MAVAFLAPLTTSHQPYLLLLLILLLRPTTTVQWMEFSWKMAQLPFQPIPVSCKKKRQHKLLCGPICGYYLLVSWKQKRYHYISVKIKSIEDSFFKIENCSNQPFLYETSQTLMALFRDHLYLHKLYFLKCIAFIIASGQLRVWSDICRFRFCNINHVVYLQVMLQLWALLFRNYPIARGRLQFNYIGNTHTTGPQEGLKIQGGHSVLN